MRIRFEEIDEQTVDLRHALTIMPVELRLSDAGRWPLATGSVRTKSSPRLAPASASYGSLVSGDVTTKSPLTRSKCATFQVTRASTRALRAQAAMTAS